MSKAIATVIILSALSYPLLVNSAPSLTQKHSLVDSGGVLTAGAEGAPIYRHAFGLLPKDWSLVFSVDRYAFTSIQWRSGERWVEALNRWAEEQQANVMIDSATRRIVVSSGHGARPVGVLFVNSQNFLHQETHNPQAMYEDAKREIANRFARLSGTNPNGLSVMQMQLHVFDVIAARKEEEIRAEQEARRIREEEAKRVRAEQEAQRLREEEAERIRMEREEQRLREEQEERMRAEQELRRIRQEEERARVEREARRMQEEEAERIRVEQEMRRAREEEAERVRAEQEARRIREEEAQARADEKARQAQAEEAERIRKEREQYIALQEQFNSNGVLREYVVGDVGVEMKPGPLQEQVNAILLDAKYADSESQIFWESGGKYRWPDNATIRYESTDELLTVIMTPFGLRVTLTINGHVIISQR